MAFSMLNVFHAVACREHNKQKTVMLAKSSHPCTALKCRSTREGGRHGARAHVKPPMEQQITPYAWVHPGDHHKAYGAPLVKRVPFRYSARSTVACSIAAGIFATDISDRAT